MRVLTWYFYVPHWLKICLAADSSGRRRPLLILLFAGPLCFFPGNAHPQTKPSSTTFAALSKRAAEARDADHLDEAVALYRRAVALQPKWEEGWWSLGTLQYDQDHYAKAARAFEKVIALNPANGTAHA